jgi:hypothetical protein
VLERNLHGQRSDIRLREVAGTGPSIDTFGGELLDPVCDTHRVLVTGNDFGSGFPEGQRDRVTDLTGATNAGNQRDLASKIELTGHQEDPRLSRTMPAPGAPA